MPRAPTERLYGTLDVLILKTLSWEPLHGYAIAEWIRERTEGTLAVEEAALYKALHRLERHGYIESEWGLSENNRRARYYRLMSAGRRALREESSAFQQYANAVLRVLRTS